MFALTVIASATALDTIKAEFIRQLPNVKSSHRCEAIGRGLGFRTYAAALAATKTETPGTAQVRGDLFATYLAEHGFDVSPKLLYHAAAKVALREVSERTPKLTMWGIGVGRPRRKEDGRWEDTREMNARFRKDRTELVGDGAVESFLTSLAFVGRVAATKTIRKGTGSYWLKHIAETTPAPIPRAKSSVPPMSPMAF